ncbi:hypothetical protein HK097_006798 [Rhizophlyctis rosea]|uniref:Reelin domain-containing protein n=1 Tax=Rhizophlyctis rosea TaxID=64517 RepID=A0AAD5SKK7_9FUNG|nr:hypothetical protein HK097_006798 [Rhizophlyctis rosea]
MRFNNASPGTAFLLGVLVLCAALAVQGRPNGAPRCSINADAIAGGHGSPSADGTGYQVSTSVSPSDSNVIIIVIHNTAGLSTLGGVLLYVSKSADLSGTEAHLGQFSKIDNANFKYQTDICKQLKVPGDDWSTVTHSNPTPKDLNTVSFEWKGLPGDEVKPGEKAFVHCAVATGPNPWQVTKPFEITIPGGNGGMMTTVTTTETMTATATMTMTDNLAACACPTIAPVQTRILKCKPKSKWGNDSGNMHTNNWMAAAPMTQEAWASAAPATEPWPPAPAAPTTAEQLLGYNWGSAATTTSCTDTTVAADASSSWSKSDSAAQPAEAPMNPPAAWQNSQWSAAAVTATTTVQVAAPSAEAAPTAAAGQGWGAGSAVY